MCGVLWGVSLGHFCNTIRLLFLSVILGAILELMGYFRGVTVAARRWPGKGKGSLQNPTLEGCGDGSIRPAPWHGAADPIACGLPATVP